MSDRYILRQQTGAGAARMDVEAAIRARGRARIIDSGPRHFLIVPIDERFTIEDVKVFDGWTVSAVETVSKVPNTKPKVEARPGASKAKLAPFI